MHHLKTLVLLAALVLVPTACAPVAQPAVGLTAATPKSGGPTAATPKSGGATNGGEAATPKSGGPTAATPQSGGQANGGEAAPPKSGGETNGGEAPAVPYTDTRHGYRVDAPGPMTANADGSASYVGPRERLEIRVLEGSAAADPARAAAADVAALRTSAAGFAVVSGPGAARVGTRTVQKLVYRWTAGTSAVTGKPLDLIAVRYYIPKNSTTLAVVTYGVTASQYDPQGADDTALTFAWK